MAYTTEMNVNGVLTNVTHFDHSAQEIDDAVARAKYLSNPNLLDNWYFGNPVNQRGQTEYTGAGYTIDRWYNVSSGTILISEDGIILPANMSEFFDQRMERYTFNIGDVVTASAMVDGVVKSTTFTVDGTWNNHILADGLEVRVVNVSGFAFNVFGLKNNSSVSRAIKATKLELGSQQTLAHQDENGNWVLNEIPNYAEELAKCQRHQYILRSEVAYQSFASGMCTSSGAATFVIHFPVQMRATPACLTEGAFAVNSASFTGISSIYASEKTKDMAAIVIKSSSLVQPNAAILQDSGTNTAALIFDANL